MNAVEEERLITVMDGEWSPISLMREIVQSGTQEDPFYIMDLGEVVARYHRWKELMPRVEPFYAVKCNDDKLLISTLAALGAGFDCASKAEIELVTSIGVAPERIIFAHPAKMASHIRYASDVGVHVMTFDSEIELIKIKQNMPHAQLMIRIRYDAAWAQCTLGTKFGCDPASEAPHLLKCAADLNLDVIGVAFHVGSGVSETEVYARAITLSRKLFDFGHDVGHKAMHLLDIGGGFLGQTHSSISEVALVINASLEEHFPERSVRVIAEPGRYFSAAAYTLAAMIFAKREESGAESTACSVWGPTCDSLDCVLPHARLPSLAPGDWLVFRDMGAYSLPVASPFNGFPVPRVCSVVDARIACMLKELHPLTASKFAAKCGAVPSVFVSSAKHTRLQPVYKESATCL